MRRQILIISAILLFLFNGVPAQAETSQFDGSWKVTMTCEPTATALGYTYKFAAQVKDGMILGQYGEENKPNSLKITGQIEPVGSSMLQATGETGNTAYAGKGAAVGRTYNYTIKAQFNGSQGTGSRMSTIRGGQRNCDFVFVKQ
jgi:hypothetical protein